MTYVSTQNGHKKMLNAAHALLDEADVIISYNGTRFDLPVLNKEFLLHDMNPPAPYKQVDLLQVARKKFRFPSNKLDYVAQALGIGEKVRHPGFKMWVDCMAGDAKAWRLMESYNKKDVELLEKVYTKMLPWIPNHPNHGAFDGRPACPHCGEDKLKARGYAITRDSKYPRYQCGGCGAWSRGTKKDPKSAKVTVVGV